MVSACTVNAAIYKVQKRGLMRILIRTKKKKSVPGKNLVKRVITELPQSTHIAG